MNEANHKQANKSTIQANWNVIQANRNVIQANWNAIHANWSASLQSHLPHTLWISRQVRWVLTKGNMHGYFLEYTCSTFINDLYCFNLIITSPILWYNRNWRQTIKH